MNLYAESSAVLAWLLEEAAGEQPRAHLAEAELVLASALTPVECERVLVRAADEGRITESQAARRRARLARARSHWHLLRLDDEVLERAGRAFPVEPVRTLDALHLSSALVAAAAVPDVRLLSLDRRVRACGEALGFSVVPE